MRANRTALVTGGTGFLGSFLIEFLLRQGMRVITVVRGPAAEERLLETLQEIGAKDLDAHRASGNLSVITGDVRSPGFGLSEAEQDALANAIDEIWHCAASFKFQEHSREEIAAHNIGGTQQVLEFTRRCNQNRITPLFHVSTAYAAPVIGGVAREVLPSEDTPFRNRYEWSKQEAERLVGAFRREYELPIVIFRPSIIIGHSRTGRAVRFTGYYDVFRALYLLTNSLSVNLGPQFDRNLHLRVGASADLCPNVVPVDFVVEAMWRLACSERGDAWIFHITNNQPPSLAFLFAQASALLSVSGIDFVDAPSFSRKPMSGMERIFNRKTQFQAPYLLDNPLFDTTHFRSVVSESSLPCPTTDETLMGRINNYYYEVLNQQFGMRQAREAKVTVQPTITSVASDASLQANY